MNKGIGIIIAGVIVVVLLIVVVSVFSGTPYVEKETAYGKIKTQVILEFADGSTDTLMFNPMLFGGLTVKYGGQEITGFYYYLTGYATGTGYEGVLIYKQDYTVDMVAKTSDGIIKDTWELVPSADNDEYWNWNVAAGYNPGEIWIPTDGTEYSILKVYVDIDDPMPTSLSSGSYKLSLNPVGQLPYRGYSDDGIWDDEWSYAGGLPDSFVVNLVVESGGALTVTYGQTWD